jgi:hypothetical protein
MPGATTVLQSRLLKWFDKLHIHPRIVGERTRKAPLGET